MTAGLRQKIDIIQMNQAPDDPYGGATFTGTVAYASVPAMLVPRMPSQQALESGLEVDTIFDLTIQSRFNGQNIALAERDQIQLVHPTDEPYYNDVFRVTGVRYGFGRRKHGPPLHCTLSRIEKSRSNDSM